ncbi:MAG: hypothetical protein JXB04_09265, partial [Kiritimatiellae bacterium]|nr:hypothetical protein [Kiritimatiellia bacterium]
LPHAERWFYQREIQHLTGIAYTPIRAALIDLEDFGLLRRETRGNRQYYTIDKGFFLYEEYKNIVLKTTGLGDHLRWAIRKHPEQIAVAFIHGDFAEGTETTDTPIRLCCIGTVPRKVFDRAVATAGKLTLKQHECLLLTPEAFRARFKRGDAEIVGLVQGKKMFVDKMAADLEKLLG